MKKGKRIGTIEEFEKSDVEAICIELSIGTCFHNKKMFQKAFPRYQIEYFIEDAKLFEAESEEA